jgi:hypothetical protein
MKYEKPVIARQNSAVQAIRGMQKGDAVLDHDDSTLASSAAYEADE